MWWRFLDGDGDGDEDARIGFCMFVHWARDFGWDILRG